MSTPRHCEFWKASDGKWYMDLAEHEYHDEDDDEGGEYGDGEYEDSTTYGPFSSGRAAYRYLDNFSNPGSFHIDKSGRRPPPTKSPNGRPVQPPRSGSYSGRYYSSGRDRDEDLEDLSDFDDPVEAPKPAPPPPVPAKQQWTAPPRIPYDNPRAAPPPAPKPQPSTQTKSKSSYKIYGAHHDANKGSSNIHTRIKGKVYVPTKPSRFKKGASANVSVDDTGATLTDPTTGNTQRWSKKESLLRRFIIGVLAENKMH